MPLYFDTLDKALSFLLAFEHIDVISSWKVKVLSTINFIPRSYLEKIVWYVNFLFVQTSSHMGLYQEVLFVVLAVCSDIRF